MSFQDKYEEYKQRKEARDFFNRNNDEKVRGIDYIIAILVGLGSTIVMGIVLTWFISLVGFNLSYFTVLIGVLEAIAIKKVLNKSGQELAIIAAVTFIVGIVIAQTLYTILTIPFFDLSIFIDIFKFYFQNMFTGSVLSTIIYLFGAVAAYMALKD